MLAETVRRRRQPANDKTENRFSILIIIFIINFLTWRQQQQQQKGDP
jgi:preprotein translocase subunit YajC